jgi:tetratricopeptide (TPR) repeat protein
MADRYIYIPSIGLFYVIGLAFYKVYTWEDNYGRIKRISLVLFLSMVIIFSVLTYQRNKIWKNSETLWLNVLENYPDAVIAHNNLGRAYYSQGRLYETIVEYQTVLMLSPGDATIHNNLGNVLAEVGDYDGAMENYKASLIIAPNWEKAYYNIGVTLSHKGIEEEKIEYLREAITYFEEALRLRPKSYRTYNSIAVNYYTMREYDKALEYIKKGIKKNPKFPYFYINLGLVLYEGYGKKDEAIEAYKKALSFDPNWDFPMERLRELGVETK